MSLRKVKYIWLLAVLSSAIIALPLLVEGERAKVWTDKEDYDPGEAVRIFGSGFKAFANVTINVKRPDGVEEVVHAITDGIGSFEVIYQLDGIKGNYAVTATDGINVAKTTFQDSPPERYDVTIDTVNGYALDSLPSTIMSPVEIKGRFSGSNVAGKQSQYGIAIDWGDGQSTIWRWSDPNNARPYLSWNPLDGNAKDFSGTYDTSPSGVSSMGHRYTSGGTYTITVKFFHQQQPGKESDAASFSITVNVIIPAISVTKSGPSFAHEDETITYTITISNPSSDATMYKVSVVDSLLGDISGSFSDSLSPMASETRTFTYNIPPASGDVTNIVTVTYRDILNQQQTDTASWTVDVLHPRIDVEKSGPSYAHEGETITYTYVMTNVGDCPLSDVSVVDSLGITVSYVSGDTNNDNLLDLTESWIFSANYVVPPNSGGEITNTATASGKDALGVVVSDSDSWSVKVQCRVDVTASPTGAQGGTFRVTYTKGGTTYTDVLQTTPWSEWVDFGSGVTVSDPQEIIYVSSDTRYKFDDYSPSANVVVDQAKTITLVYKTQYRVRIAWSGLESDATGKVVTINIDSVSNVKNAGDSYFDEFVDEGLTVGYYFEDFVLSSTTGKRYELYSVSGTSSDKTHEFSAISGPITETGNYKAQYLVTFEVDPPGSGSTTPSGSQWCYAETIPVQATANLGYVFSSWSTDEPSISIGDPSSPSTTATIGGSGKIKANFAVAVVQITINSIPAGAGLIRVDGVLVSTPITFNWGIGSTHTLEAVSQVAGPTGIRYVFESWSDGGDQVHIYVVPSAPETVTAVYKTQYYLTVISPYDTPGGEGWYDSGTTAYATLADGAVSGGAGIGYVFTGWSGDASGTGLTSNPIVMDSPKTAIANWKTQFQVKFDVAPAGAGSTSPSGLNWYDSGSSVVITATAAADYTFSTWSVDNPAILISDASSPSTTATINGPGTITANFVFATVSITITSDPATGTGFVKVDDVTISTPKTFVWDVGSVHKLEALSTVSGPTGVRYIFESWSDGGAQVHDYVVPNTDAIVTATYRVQYYLTVVSLYDTPGGYGWYDSGATAYATLSEDSVIQGGARYKFTGWSGDASGANLKSNSILMDGPKTAVANWVLQSYIVTFDKSPRQGSITVDDVTYNALPVVLEWAPGSSHVVVVPAVESGTAGVRYIFSRWEDGSTVTTRSLISDTPGARYVAYCDTQYRLDVYSRYGTTSGSGWYNAGTEVRISVTPTRVVDAAGVEHNFSGWIGSGSGAYYTGPDNPALVIMTGPVQEEAVWSDIAYYLNVVSVYGSPYGSGWYPPNSEAEFGVTTPVDQGNGTLRVFVKWSGDVELFEPKGTIVMKKPSEVIASWDTMYLVTFNTTLPSGEVLYVTGVPEILSPSLKVFVAYYLAGTRIEVGPAPSVVEGSGGTRYIFEGWLLDGMRFTSEANAAFVVDGPHEVALAYGTEYMLTVRAVGVSDNFSASLVIATSPPNTNKLTPAEPVVKWVRQGATVSLWMSTPNKIGHGEWSIFKEWSGDVKDVGRTTLFVMSGPKTVDAVFFKVNPVAESIPFSLLAGIIMVVVSYCLSFKTRRRKDEEGAEGEKRQSRFFPMSMGIMVSAVALIVAAVVSCNVAISYYINTSELLDFTNWAVLFLVVEAIVFFAATWAITTRSTRHKKTVAAEPPTSLGGTQI